MKNHQDEFQSVLSNAERLAGKGVRTLREGTCKHCGAIDAAHGNYMDSKGAFKRTHEFEAGVYVSPVPQTLEHRHIQVSTLDAIDEAGHPATIATFSGVKGDCKLCQT